MALVAQGDESLALPGRRGRRLSASREPWEEMSMALFRRLDPAATGHVHQDQLQCIWPTLTQHVEGVPRELKAQRRQRSAQVSTAEWQSLMAALCAVVGARRFKSSMRRADVVISKGFQTPKPGLAPLASSVSLPQYEPLSLSSVALAEAAMPSQDSFISAAAAEAASSPASPTAPPPPPPESKPAPELVETLKEEALAQQQLQQEQEKVAAGPAPAIEVPSAAASQPSAAVVQEVGQDVCAPSANTASLEVSILNASEGQAAAQPDNGPQPATPASSRQLPSPSSGRPSPKSERPASRSGLPSPKSDRPAPSSLPASPASGRASPKSGLSSPKPRTPSHRSGPTSPKSEAQSVADDAGGSENAEFPGSQQPSVPQGSGSVPEEATELPPPVAQAAKEEVRSPSHGQATPQVHSPSHAKATAQVHSPSYAKTTAQAHSPSHAKASAQVHSPSHAKASAQVHSPSHAKAATPAKSSRQDARDPIPTEVRFEQDAAAPLPGNEDPDIQAAQLAGQAWTKAQTTAWELTEHPAEAPLLPPPEDGVGHEAETAAGAAEGNAWPDLASDEAIVAAIALIPVPKSEVAPAADVVDLPSADNAEAEAFVRRFRQLRAAEQEAQHRSSSSLSRLVDDAGTGSQPMEEDRRHDVMGVNTRVLQEVRAAPVDPDELETVEFNLAEPQKRKRQVWDHRGNTALSWSEDFDEVTASRSSAVRDTRRDPTSGAESQALGSREPSQGLRTVAPSSGASSQGSVWLPRIEPKLSRANTAPSSVRMEDSMEDSVPIKDSIQSALESSSVKALRERLRSEMTLHEQTRAHAQELERRLQLAMTRKRDLRAASEEKPRFGVASGAPYAAKAAKTDKEKRSVVLPPLRSPKPSAPPRRAGDPVGPVVQEMLREERMSALSRQEQSRTRIQAFSKLGHAGLSTWDVRLEEKVSRFQDMRAFSESMWNSFYDWNSQYQTLG